MFPFRMFAAVPRRTVLLVVALGAVGYPALPWATPSLQQGERSWRNPCVPICARAARPVQTEAPVVAASSPAALIQVLAAEIDARLPELTIELAYDFSFAQVEGIIDDALEQVLAADDYRRYTFSGYGARWSGRDGEVTIGLSLSYLTDAQQEALVDARVEALRAQLFDSRMNAEQLELAAHDWLVTHVEYDVAGVSGQLRYTAFGALSAGVAVCQGYALTFYRLCRAAGLEVRIVSGLGNGEDHAWNLVRVCGAWYHVDPTWDDPLSDPPAPQRIHYRYFNRSDAELRVDHSWEADGLPAAVTSYVSGVCVGAVRSLTWTLDRAEALAAARSQGKRLMAVVGRPQGRGTTEMLQTVFQWYWPKVRPLLQADFVVWLSDVDQGDQWQPLTAGLGSFELPLMCVVDPASPETPLARLTGACNPADFLSWLRPWAPSVATALRGSSWGELKRRVQGGR